MFTGLIEQVGQIERITPSDGARRIAITHAPWSEPLVVGESVAVQGVCLTVESAETRAFVCAVLDETARCSTLASRRPGSAVNLERALKVGDRLGGHIMSGHVDGTGSLVSVTRSGADRIVRVRCSPAIMQGVVAKGSIGLDGVSLTVAALGNDGFEVAIIPHTWEHTALHTLKADDPVNIEQDMLGKYVARHLAGQTGGVSESLLRDAGWT